VGSIVTGYIFPHPPIIVPEVGKDNESPAIKTIEAVKKAAAEIKHDRPTTIILTTPHGEVFQDYIHISTSEILSGGLGKFGSSNVKLKFSNNPNLIEKIIRITREEGIMAGGLEDSIIKKYKFSRELDHGALVPLYFVEKEYCDFKLVHVSIAGLSFIELYKFGICVDKAVKESDERVVFLASGDLSHRLSEDAPYGYNARGPEFDNMFVNSIKNLQIENLLQTEESFCESAGECGLRSFLMMFGALDGYNIIPEVYSYEGPFGVGYSVARFQVGERNPERNILKQVENKNKEAMKKARESEDHYVSLARKSLEAYICENRILKVPDGLPGEMYNKKAGTFVSIKKFGQLRGCIGTTSATRKCIAEEIINNAISSGTQDPRFNEVIAEELDSLVYSVDILGNAEAIGSMDELDVIRFGVIVRSGRRSGLLLPNLEGVDTPEQQVSIALQKAGISPDEKYTLERFEVVRHK
jgi:AmmeMemoRadiSam system protein A